MRALGFVVVAASSALLSIWGGAGATGTLRCAQGATTVSISDANGNAIDTIDCSSGSVTMPNGVTITQGVSTVAGSAAGDVTIEGTTAAKKVVLKNGTLNALVQVRVGTTGGGSFNVVRDSDGQGLISCSATNPTPFCDLPGGASIGGGALFKKIVRNSVVQDFAAIAANTCSGLSVSLPGATVNGICLVGCPEPVCDNVTYYPKCTLTADTLQLYVCNGSAALGANPPSATFNYLSLEP